MSSILKHPKKDFLKMHKAGKLAAQVLDYINDFVEVNLEQNQFDALVSWVFNLGPANLKASTLLKVLNAKDYEGVPAQIKRWNKAGGKVLQGLIRRREAESLLFEGKEWHEV